MLKRTRLVYPFSAIVGQENMKKALLLNTINPKIGGLLIRGEKGTAKSMAVRALAQLLPQIDVVSNCPFRCDPRCPDDLCDTCAARAANGEKLGSVTRQVPVVEMPIGATEDRVVGTLDIEKVIKTGEKHFEPGLLAAANRGILYIDEVNLLDDHLVDVLLDAAAMGVNFVEREGISFSHPSQFILVGTMNPEEGELRPQLLDRFGLSVEVRGIPEEESRAEVVRRRIAFEADPAYFVSTWEEQQEVLRQRVLEAKKLLPGVKLSESLLKLITLICTEFAVDGHRADIVIHKTATTIAAYRGRTEVNVEDIKEAAELALLHRRRRQPFEKPELDRSQLESSLEKWRREDREIPREIPKKERDTPPIELPPDDDSEDTVGSSKKKDEEPPPELVFQAATPYRVIPLVNPVLDQVSRSGAGRRSKTRTSSKTGRYVDAVIPQGKVTDLAFDATLRAAAPFQAQRRQETRGQNALLVESRDLREKVREKKVGNLIVFVLDASGSMAAEERMIATKGAVLSLLLDAYQRRDRVGMVVFRGDKAELVLPPTNSVELAQKHLTELPTGGRTPLACGLKLGLETIKDYMWKDKHCIPLLVLVSDGDANVDLSGDTSNEGVLRLIRKSSEEAKMVCRAIRAEHIRSIVIDTEQERIAPWRVATRLIKQISAELGGRYMRLEELRSDPITYAVKSSLGYAAGMDDSYGGAAG